MKILHVVPSYKPAYIYGGPIESVANLCEALVERGNEVSVFTTTANGEAELDVKAGKAVIVDNVSVIYFPRLTKGNTHISPQLWKYLYQHCDEYDVIHIHSWWNILVIISAIICHHKGSRVIISPRGMLSDYIITKTHATAKKWIHETIGKSALQKAIFHATSEAEYNECQHLIQNWNGFLLPNLLNLPLQPINRSNNEVFTIVFLSRIHPKKGLEFLFEAISQIRIPVRLRIAGTGEDSYIQKLKEDTVALKIDHIVEWVGWRSKEDKYIELGNADLFALTSYNENFANVVVESLYAGTPVLISDKVGLAHFVEENDLGWVTHLEVSSIVNSIRQAIGDKRKRAIINAIGRDKITENFSKKILIDRYIGKYNLI
ncbi:XrtY-associated glycosyltransferase XYAG1 [Spirosoma sp. KUDC1026]|uniref:XrtY-associated glycosyltransferase XYAG1 n=1 Tax=Spirosoma sp. KUDC1026 TaxID=2745947 RepID=UPI00159B8816|nr:glycosyltransferase [Spirosoma sp. KUDC1026]QKZ15430.1 glycosyltransferase [Spirosoma sp. KUDC1026]